MRWKPPLNNPSDAYGASSPYTGEPFCCGGARLPLVGKGSWPAGPERMRGVASIASDGGSMRGKGSRIICEGDHLIRPFRPPSPRGEGFWHARQKASPSEKGEVSAELTERIINSAKGYYPLRPYGPAFSACGPRSGTVLNSAPHCCSGTVPLRHFVPHLLHKGSLSTSSGLSGHLLLEEKAFGCAPLPSKKESRRMPFLIIIWKRERCFQNGLSPYLTARPRAPCRS